MSEVRKLKTFHAKLIQDIDSMVKGGLLIGLLSIDKYYAMIL